MKTEEEIRLQILREVRNFPKGKGLGYPRDRLMNKIAVEMIDRGLVLGSAKTGTACITGIREAGLKLLEEQKPHRKALAAGRRGLFVLYSFALLAIGYILNLDSVKTFFSDLIGKFLK